MKKWVIYQERRINSDESHFSLEIWKKIKEKEEYVKKIEGTGDIRGLAKLAFNAAVQEENFELEEDTDEITTVTPRLDLRRQVLIDSVTPKQILEFNREYQKLHPPF